MSPRLSAGRDEPLVSVVMAVRDGERFLPRSLGSIRAQTHANLELIVVDGDSRDRSVEVARSYGARVLRQDGDGFMDAWNQGLAAASGDYFALLDCDDHWVAGKTEAQLRLLRERPELDYAIGMVRFFVEEGSQPPPSFKRSLLGRDHVAHMPGALLAPLELFATVGDFRTDLTIASDIEWFQRMTHLGLRGEVAPGALTHKSVHDDNVSFGSKGAVYQHELLTLLRESVRRGAA